MPTEQTPAPDFSLPAEDGSIITLASLRGRPAVIYFYPKDDTPVCTKKRAAFATLFQGSLPPTLRFLVYRQIPWRRM